MVYYTMVAIQAALKLGRVIQVTFCPGQTRFKNYLPDWIM